MPVHPRRLAAPRPARVVDEVVEATRGLGEAAGFGLPAEQVDRLGTRAVGTQLERARKSLRATRMRE